MSIRDIQLSNVTELRVSLELAKHLFSLHVNDPSYVMRCRDEVLRAAGFGCDELAIRYGHTIECYERSTYWRIDFLSDRHPEVQALVLLYNAAHPDCDFARCEIERGDYEAAYRLLEVYIGWVESIIAFIE